MAKITSNKISSSTSSSWSSSTNQMFAAMAILIVILNVTLFMPTKVSARYLPTRSNDQFRRQEIKEILRLLLDMPADESNSGREPGSMVGAGWSGNGRPSDAYDVSSIRVARQIQDPTNAMAPSSVASMVASNAGQRSKRSILTAV